MHHRFMFLLILRISPAKMKILQKFWVESMPTPKSSDLMSHQELECERHFQDTHSRDSSVRFTVELPFKFEEPKFPGIFTAAKLSLLWAEKRFCCNSKLRDCYYAFMREYIDLYHMSEVRNENSISSNEIDASYFITHHGICQGNSLDPIV